MTSRTCEHGVPEDNHCYMCDAVKINRQAFEQLLEEGQRKRLRGRSLRKFVMNRMDKTIKRIKERK